MIGSKYVDFSIATWLQGRLTIELISQSIPNNQSVYKAKIHISRKNSETFRYGNTRASLYTTISGPGYSSSTKNRAYDWNISSTWILVREETITVTHNANGTPPSSTFYGAITDSYQGWNGNGTLTYTFPTIPRYTTVTNPSISSITRNSYTFSFSTGHTINEWQYSSNGGTWQAGQTGDRTSGSKNLSGFGANTKPTIKVRVKRKDSGLWTESGTVTVTLEATASPNTPTFSSITRNSFVINVKANKSFNGFQYSLNDGSSWSAKQSGSSVSITGRNANTLHNVRVKVYDGVHTGTLSGASSRGQVRTLAIASPNTPTLASKTAIQVVFNWSANQTVTNVQYKRWSSDAWQSAGNDFSARTSGSVTIPGLSPNTTYSISVRVKDAVHGTWSGGSGNLSVATYTLSTITGSNTTVDTGSKSFAISKAVSSMSQDVILQMWADSQKWIDIKSWTNTNGGGFSLTSSEIASIQNNRAGSNTLSVRYQCTTRWGSGGTIQGTTHSPQYTWTLVNVNPTLDGATYKDVHTNATFVSWKGGDQKILRNSSLLRITLGKANAIKGAKLSKYVLTIAGKQFTVNATSGATEQSGATLDAGVVDAGTNQTATIEVFDTRGNKVTRTLTVQMIDWSKPQLIHGTGERLNSYEQPTYLNFLARYSRIIVGGVDVNELTAQYRIKVKGSADSTYGAFVDIIAPKGSVNGIWQEVKSTQFMQNLDENTTYTMHIRYKDPVVSFIDYYVDIEMGVGLMEFFEDKVELGVPLYDKNSMKKYLLEGEGGGGSVSWANVSSKPAQATRWPTWSEVTDKPSTFAPATHSHAWSTITSRPGDNQFPNTAQALGASQNLNNYTTPGFYYQSANANASTANNYPVARAGTLIVTKDAGITQMYYEYNGTGVFYRTFYSSSWTAWQNLLTPTWANVSSKPAQATRWPTWSEVTSKPSTFTPSSHTHSRSQTSLRGATTIASGGSYSLSQSILNFDMIVIHYSTSYTSSSQYNADTWVMYPHGHPTSTTGPWSIGYGRTGRWVDWQFTSATTIHCVGLGNTITPRIRAIYGVKFTT